MQTSERRSLLPLILIATAMIPLVFLVPQAALLFWLLAVILLAIGVGIGFRRYPTHWWAFLLLIFAGVFIAWFLTGNPAPVP